MHATNILRNFLVKELPFIHKKRLESLLFSVNALIAGGRLSLSALGRGARGNVAPKHSIKRVDRLLGNCHLVEELPAIFQSICTLVLQGKSEPLVLIDWTQLDDEFWSLSAAIPADGRAIPIYWEVHPKKKIKNRKVQTAFIQNLKKLIPHGWKPIIVTDAGFQNPWFDAVSELGWDYVGRLSGQPYLRLPEEDWCLAPTLYPLAGKANKDLGLCCVAKSSDVYRRVVLAKEYVRNPKRHKAKRRRSDRGRGNKQTVKRSKEPWLITTSLTDVSANRIIKIYAQRMQIEESYRDLKNHRFGWSFSHAKTRDPNRFAILLLIASIGNIAMTLLGQAAENEGLHFGYQANTLKHRRVLSLFYLAKTMVLRNDLAWCKMRHIKQALMALRSKIHTLVTVNTWLFEGIF